MNILSNVLLAGSIGLLSGCGPQQANEDQERRGSQHRRDQEQPGQPNKQSSPTPAQTAFTANQKEATAAAIKALGRVEAATQVGVNFQRYGGAVIDAKSAVNEAERVLPDGDLRFWLSRAMRDYADANTVWSWKIEVRAGLSEKLHKEIIDRYQLRPAMNEAGYVNCDVAIQVMWASASEILAATRELEKKPNQDNQLSRLEVEKERKYKEAEAKGGVSAVLNGRGHCPITTSGAWPRVFALSRTTP
jgi:hypothetical protein